MNTSYATAGDPPISGERKGKPDRRRSPSVHASHGNQEPQKGGVRWIPSMPAA